MHSSRAVRFLANMFSIHVHRNVQEAAMQKPFRDGSAEVFKRRHYRNVQQTPMQDVQQMPIQNLPGYGRDCGSLEYDAEGDCCLAAHMQDLTNLMTSTMWSRALTSSG